MSDTPEQIWQSLMNQTPPQQASEPTCEEKPAPEEEPTRQTFTLPSEFVRLVNQCISLAQHQIQLFDPNFTRWGMEHADIFQALRHFLLLDQKNRLQLAMHQTHYLANECPRFMPFFTDFSHAIECRITPRNLRQLTDSFCIADQRHIVRRYHCDHFRGEAVFHSGEATQISSKRFADIWLASDIGIHASRLGL